MSNLTDKEIARVCHQVNIVLRDYLGDTGANPRWEDASDEQRYTVTKGVSLARRYRISPAQSHAAWLVEKTAQGWTYGPVKDEEKKTHPCMVPYEDLDRGQRLKDHVFLALVDALA